MKILIVGGGNMGTTFAEGFLSAHIVRPTDLMILEHNAGRLAWLRERLKARVFDMPDAFIQEADLIVLAVKPQDAPTLYASLRAYVEPRQLILSIMAGVRIASIQEAMGSEKVIRSMPNLPAQVGMGMTAFTASAAVDGRELIEVQNLLSTTGRAIYFDDERMIDASTAISGSGPAYVFFMMDAMIGAAMDIGFSESQAELLVWQTFMGAVHLHNKNDISCSEWVRRVASKGGTTEAALKVFEQGELQQTLHGGILAAFERAMELGK